jgi:hypothetical protein
MPATNMRRFAREVRTLPQQWVDDSVKAVARTATRAITGDTGGDRRLSGMRGRGSALRVTTKVSGTSVVHGEAVAGPAKARAQWFWREEGARRRRVGRTRAVHTWERSVPPEMLRARSALVRDFQRIVRG